MKILRMFLHSPDIQPAIDTHLRKAFPVDVEDMIEEATEKGEPMDADEIDTMHGLFCPAILSALFCFFQSIHATKLTIHVIAVIIIFQFSDITNESRKR